MVRSDLSRPRDGSNCRSNDAEYEGSLSQYKDSVPYILNYLQTSRKFITTVDENNLTTISFGAGVDGVDDAL